jgi:hypothetical protein
MIARRAARVGALCLAGAVLVAPAPATAYVRYRTSEGNAYSWRSTSVPITAYPQDLLDSQGNVTMTIDQVTNAGLQAAATWSKENPVLTPCSYLELAVAPSSQTAPDAQYDHVNIMVTRTGIWEDICSPGPASDPTPVCHQSGQLALTTVFTHPSGEIVDADIEVNADPAEYTWHDLITDPGSQTAQDLQNALTHETGHFIGLDHTCYIDSSVFPVDSTGQPIIPLDSNGDKVPPCSNATATEMHAVMFPSATPGDTSKRTLTPDDAAGICAIYPVGSLSTGGCSVASPVPPTNGPVASRGRGWLVVGLVTSLAATIARRRKRPT